MSSRRISIVCDKSPSPETIQLGQTKPLRSRIERQVLIHLVEDQPQYAWFRSGVSGEFRSGGLFMCDGWSILQHKPCCLDQSYQSKRGTDQQYQCASSRNATETETHDCERE